MPKNIFENFFENLHWERKGDKELVERTLESKIGFLKYAIQEIPATIKSGLYTGHPEFCLPSSYKRHRTERILFMYHRNRQAIISDRYFEFCEGVLDEYETFFHSKLRKSKSWDLTRLIILENKELMEEIQDDSTAGFALKSDKSIFVLVEEELPENERYNALLELTRHELSHLYSWQINPDVPLAVEEGCAMFLENADTLDEIAREKLSTGNIYRVLQTPDEIFMTRNRALIHYFLAGSFTKYLVSSFGQKTYADFYRAVSQATVLSVFEERFGTTYRECEEAWKSSLIAL